MISKRNILIICIVLAIILIAVFIKINKNKKIEEEKKIVNSINQVEIEPEEITIDALYGEENVGNVFLESDLADY